MRQSDGKDRRTMTIEDETDKFIAIMYGAVFALYSYDMTVRLTGTGHVHIYRAGKNVTR